MRLGSDFVDLRRSPDGMRAGYGAADDCNGQEGCLWASQSCAGAPTIACESLAVADCITVPGCIAQ
jgi:hypothetical protein